MTSSAKWIVETVREEVARQLSQQGPTTGWVTVVSVDPLEVRVDGDSVPQPIRRLPDVVEGGRAVKLKVGSRWYLLGGSDG